MLLALISPPGWGFIAAYLLHFLPLLAALGLSIPMIRTGDRRRWLHTGMVVAAADFFSLAFGAVVVLLGGTTFWRVLSGLGLAVWAIVFVAFVVFLLRIAGTRKREFSGDLDAVVVLGAGLVGDRPGPLLAARVDRGIAAAPADRGIAAAPADQGFATRAETSMGFPLIMTGGQGPDEPVSEAWAMAMYARERHGQVLRDKGLRLLEEDRATNTRENLRFSLRQLWQERAGGVEQKKDGAAQGRITRVGIVTSDFHVSRTEMTARTVAELVAHGRGEQEAQHGSVEFTVIGAETPRVARPAAYIREFVALALWKARDLL